MNSCMTCACHHAHWFEVHVPHAPVTMHIGSNSCMTCACHNAHLQRKMVCSAPHATRQTPSPSSSGTWKGSPLSRNVRVPSCPQLLLPHVYTLLSVAATVCCPPAAMYRTPCAIHTYRLTYTHMHTFGGNTHTDTTRTDTRTRTHTHTHTHTRKHAHTHTHTHTCTHTHTHTRARASACLPAYTYTHTHTHTHTHTRRCAGCV